MDYLLFYNQNYLHIHLIKIYFDKAFFILHQEFFSPTACGVKSSSAMISWAPDITRYFLILLDQKMWLTRMSDRVSDWVVRERETYRDTTNWQKQSRKQEGKVWRERYGFYKSLYINTYIISIEKDILLPSDFAWYSLLSISLPVSNSMVRGFSLNSRPLILLHHPPKWPFPPLPPSTII